MTSRRWVAAAIAATLIAACDVSHKTPQTAPPSADLSGGFIGGGTVDVAGERSESGGAGYASVKSGEKSIRLQGPGVHRARQIRV